jgi:hypothetical protein
MSKRETANDLFDKMVPPELPTQTEAVNVPEGRMTPHMIRMPDDIWNQLSAHFKSRGLNASAGIRQVLFEYLREEGIR